MRDGKRIGKAEPFRISGGTAANDLELEMSEINVQLKDGVAVAMPASSTIGDALKKLDRDLAKQALAAKVTGREHPVDLATRLDDIPKALGPERLNEFMRDGALQIDAVVPDPVEGLDVLRHSTAHLLAAAVLDLFPGTKLGIGPALLDDPRYGFFYDVIAPRALTEADLPVIEKKMRDIAKRNMSYRRDEISKAEALRVFQERDEPLKCELIDEKAGETVSVYYIDGSPFIDFCLGPHVPNTNRLKAFKLLSLAGAYWKGDAERPQMQRIYGTAFFTQDELDAWLRSSGKRQRSAIIDGWGASSICFRFRKTTDRDWCSGIRRAALFAVRWKTICAQSSSAAVMDWSSLRTSLSATCGGLVATKRTMPT